MNTYELSFVTDPIDEETEWQLLGSFDAMMASHSAVHMLSIAATGDSAFEAAKDVLPELEALGVRVRRLNPELVTQATIASRTGKSRQTVSNWVNGQRQAGNAFPLPYAVASGALWLWSDVNEWLRRTSGEAHDGLCYAPLRDIERFNVWLDNRRLVAPPTFKYVEVGEMAARQKVVGVKVTSPSTP